MTSRPACGNKHCQLKECNDSTPRPKYGRAHRDIQLELVKAVDPDLLDTFGSTNG